MRRAGCAGWSTPTGAAKDFATVLPACVTTVRRLRRDQRVPRRAKVVLVLAGLWVLSPIDLIPEFIPVIGPLDDVLVVAFAFRYAARQVPREVLFEAWPAEPRILERLIPTPAKYARRDRVPGVMGDAERDRPRRPAGTARARASPCHLQRRPSPAHQRVACRLKGCAGGERLSPSTFATGQCVGL